MEKEKQIAVNNATISSTNAMLQDWLKRSNKLISSILEEQVSNANALRMCNISISFTVMVISANYSPITTAVGMAWLITAIIDLKTNLKQ